MITDNKQYVGSQINKNEIENYQHKILNDNEFLIVNGNKTFDLFIGDGKTTIKNSKSYGSESIPLKSIVLWSGKLNNIPSEFALCDGKTINGITTPNMTDMFIKSVSSQTLNNPKINHNNQYKLTPDNLPSHTHNLTTNPHSHTTINHNHSLKDLIFDYNSWSHTHSVYFLQGHIEGQEGFDIPSIASPPNVVTNYTWEDKGVEMSGSHSHNLAGSIQQITQTSLTSTLNATINNYGNNNPIKIELDYYELAFIMKVYEDEK